MSPEQNSAAEEENTLKLVYSSISLPSVGQGKKKKEESEVPVSCVTLGEGDWRGTKTDMQIKIPWIAKPVKTKFGNVTPSYKYKKGNPPPAHHCLAGK